MASNRPHRRLRALVTLVVVASACGGPPPHAEDAGPAPPLLRAHAHNDYRHKRPLLDALDHGFTSVEADIFLVDGKLLVGHDRTELRPERTLEKLYLEPLRERARAHRGKVYPGGPELTLLIDLKSEAEATYKALSRALAEFADIISVVRDGVLEAKAVRVVISGNRPRELMEAEKERFAGFDGRLEDLSSKAAADFMPLISDHWGRNFAWRGDGPMPAAEREKLKAIVAAAHAKGRRVRFWATPESPALWKELRDAGVDLINTDELAKLRDFLGEAAAKEGKAPGP